MSEALAISIDEAKNSVAPTQESKESNGTDVPSIRKRLGNLYSNHESKFSRRKKSSTMKVNHLPTVDELLSQMDELQLELMRKDNDLKLASEIGTLLLEKNDEMTNRVTSLELELENKTTELSSSQAQFREHQLNHKRYVAMLEDQEKLNEAQGQEIRGLQHQLTQAQAKQDAVTRAQSNSVLVSQTEMEVSQTELKESKALAAKLDHQIVELKNILKREQQTAFTLQDELTEARKENQKLRKIEQKCDQLENELTRERKEISELRDIQWENKQLTQTCRELTITLENLHKMHEQESKNYQRAQEKVEALKDHLNKIKVEQNSKAPNKQAEKDKDQFISLAEELVETVHEEKEGMDAQLAKEVESGRKKVESAKPVIEKAEKDGDGKEIVLNKDGLGGKENMTDEEKKERDAMYEFFALTTLAVKINSGEMMESLYMVSAKDLWKKAQEEHVQFHQYHRWIQTQITKSFFYHLYTPKRKFTRTSRTAATAQPIRPDHQGPEKLDPMTAVKK
jgi:hypothetical protein